MADADTPQGGDEVNVDELLADVERATPERAMTGGETPPEAEAPAAPTWDGKSWEFEWNGKKIVPDSQDKVRTWMQQGYNYSQRMGEFNRTKAETERAHQQAQTELQQRMQALNPYQRVDEYARQNPQWWQHTLQAFEQAQKGQQPGQVDPNLQSVLKPLEERLGKFEQYFGQIEQEKLQENQKKEDRDLDQEVDSIRKEFPTIDLNAVDPESGKTLENRILEHASQMFGHLPAYKTGVFKAAFRDYLHDKLIEHAKASGREAVAKDAQVNAKKGILGKTPAPVKGVQPTAVRGKSYNDLANEALRELGLTS